MTAIPFEPADEAAPPTTARPRPILAAIRSGAWLPLVGTLLTAAVTFGLLNSEQGTAIGNLVAAVATLLTAITAALSNFHVLRRAEPEVTPVADPRDDLGRALVPERGPAPPVPFS